VRVAAAADAHDAASETVAELSALLLQSHRFISVVGAGGMGKTTVAVAVAYALLDDFDNAVFFVDLSTLTDAALLPFSISSALGLHAPLPPQDPMAGILAFVDGNRILLVLDCCEHVIASAVAAIERLFSEPSARPRAGLHAPPRYSSRPGEPGSRSGTRHRGFA
jgi:predicted ATPase